MENQIVLNNLLVSYSKVSGGQDSVIFLHGWRSNKEVWGNIVTDIRKLGNLDIAIYTIDLPGFGKSQLPKHAMTVGDYAGVVEQFISKLELKNVTIIGHSFGGRVGIKLAAKYSQIINRLVLVDAAGFAMESNKKNLINTAAKIVKPFFKPQFMQGLRKSIYKTIGAEDYLATPELQKTFVNITSEDLTEDMKQIKCPTLIITGENDQDTPVEFGKRMNSLIQNSQFQIIPGAGHFSFLDQPEKFMEQFKIFL